MSNDITTALAGKPIGRLLLQYSLPAIIASLATSLYNIVDSIFIGRGVGPMALTGLAITFPLMNLVTAFCVLIAVGGSTVSSIFMGQKRMDKTELVVGNVTIVVLLHSMILVTLGLFFLDPVLYFFGATDQSIDYAREFMRIILLATPLSYIFLSLNNIMRATGYPRKAMISALFSVVVNIAVAPVLIFVLDWGMRGAAIATVAGQTAGLVWVLIHFMSPKSNVHFTRGCWKLSGNIIKRMYEIGLSPFLMNCCTCFVVVLINHALLKSAGADGNLAVGAYGIINRTTTFFIMIIWGVTQGMQPILGFNYGAACWPRVSRTLRLGLMVASVISAIGFAATELFPDQISKLFTTDVNMIDIARPGFRIFFMFYLLVGPQIVIQNYFQSIGHPKLSIFLSLTRQLIFLVPGLWLLPPLLGVDGVWTAMCSSDCLAFILAVITGVVMNRHIKKELTQMAAQRIQK